MRTRAIFLGSLVAALALAVWPFFGFRAAAAGPLIKGSGPAVYYVSGGKRFVFPNEKVYFSWYSDFGGVTAVSDVDLASYQIGGNVTYRPASRLVKLQTDPKVYAVDAGGRLRWVASEDAAKGIFGEGWNKKIDDLPDSFFFNYRIADPVYSAADFSPATLASVSSIDADLAARAGEPVSEDAVAVRNGAWTDRMVWRDQKLPSSGSKVTVPAGLRVVFDSEDSGSLRSLEIDGTLALGEFSTAARLISRSITVKGTLAFGTADSPVASGRKATIILTGEAEGGGLNVVGGTLDLHGAPIAISWTKLAKAAAKGSNEIKLAAPADGWKTGDYVAVASTSVDPAESEKHAISSLKGDSLVLAEPLAHAHDAGETAAEVALISRNVSVVGPGNVAGLRVSAGSTVRIEGAGFSGLGAADADDARPIVFDGLGSASASYVRDSSIDSSAGCLTLRGTNGLSVEDVAAYDIRGTCFETGTGAETRNVFDRDLAMLVRGQGSAAFLLRNPDNDLTDSVSAGAEGAGFWYSLPDTASGASGTVSPRETKLGLFSGNSAHSGLSSGLFVDDTAGKADYAPGSKAVFAGFRAWRNADYGFWVRGTNVEVSGAWLAENRVGGSFAAFGGSLKGSTAIGWLDAAAGATDKKTRTGFLFHDGPVMVSDTLFRDFKSAGDSAALGFLGGNRGFMDPRSGYQGVTFDNSLQWHAADPVEYGDKISLARDYDSASTSVAARSPFLDDGCALKKEWNMLVCDAKYSQFTVAVRDIPDLAKLTVERTDNGSSVVVPAGPAFEGGYAYVTVVEGDSYRLRPGPARHLGIQYDGTSRPLTVKIPASAVLAAVDGVSAWSKVDLKELRPGTWAYDSAAGEAVLSIGPSSSVDVSW